MRPNFIIALCVINGFCYGNIFKSLQLPRKGSNIARGPAETATPSPQAKGTEKKVVEKVTPIIDLEATTEPMEVIVKKTSERTEVVTSNYEKITEDNLVGKIGPITAECSSISPCECDCKECFSLREQIDYSLGRCLHDNGLADGIYKVSQNQFSERIELANDIRNQQQGDYKSCKTELKAEKKLYESCWTDKLEIKEKQLEEIFVLNSQVVSCNATNNITKTKLHQCTENIVSLNTTLWHEKGQIVHLSAEKAVKEKLLTNCTNELFLEKHAQSVLVKERNGFETRANSSSLDLESCKRNMSILMEQIENMNRTVNLCIDQKTEKETELLECQSSKNVKDDLLSFSLSNTQASKEEVLKALHVLMGVDALFNNYGNNCTAAALMIEHLMAQNSILTAQRDEKEELLYIITGSLAGSLIFTLCILSHYCAAHQRQLQRMHVGE